MLIDVLLFIALTLTVIVVVSVIAHIWATVPYVPTQYSLVHEALDMADIKNGDVLYDLGAGDGRVLTEAVKKQPSIRAIGYECVLSVWLWSKIRTFRSRKSVSLRFGNFFSQDLSDADIVFVYLFPKVMEKLEKKFRRELRPGTRIVSHAFRFKDLQPVKEQTVKCGRRDRRLMLYVWPSYDSQTQ